MHAQAPGQVRHQHSKQKNMKTTQTTTMMLETKRKTCSMTGATTVPQPRLQSIDCPYIRIIIQLYTTSLTIGIEHVQNNDSKIMSQMHVEIRLCASHAGLYLLLWRVWIWIGYDNAIHKKAYSFSSCRCVCARCMCDGDIMHTCVDLVSNQCVCAICTTIGNHIFKLNRSV